MFEVQGVTRTYAGAAAPAVQEVDLVVRAGDRLGIVGESGSGKSTLIRMMAGLDRPTAGRILFRGEPISHLPDRDLAGLRAGVQMVFQDPRSSLNPRMKVGASITEPLRSPVGRAHGFDRTRVRERLIEVLTEVGLEAGDADRYPHEFSGGQRQRIALARALAPHPDVLIADEPVSALDVSVRAQVLNLINELVATRNLTLVFVSHDLGVVHHLCESVAVMREGRIVESGTAAQVYHSPQAHYTRQLLAAVPRLA